MGKIEVKLEAVPKLVDWECECGGEMEFTGVALLSSPTQYQHRCLECGKEMNLLHTYPYVEVEYLCDGEVIRTEEL